MKIQGQAYKQKILRLKQIRSREISVIGLKFKTKIGTDRFKMSQEVEAQSIQPLIQDLRENNHKVQIDVIKQQNFLIDQLQQSLKLSSLDKDIIIDESMIKQLADIVSKSLKTSDQITCQKFEMYKTPKDEILLEKEFARLRNIQQQGQAVGCFFIESRLKKLKGIWVIQNLENIKDQEFFQDYLLTEVSEVMLPMELKKFWVKQDNSLHYEFHIYS
ncbi:UNKNOWN [Stylonychia lemnae]|uniref:Uncharacterized protein n=1 Tax=Stylonychia lemnae TaxID=5949 RepID=A0A078A3G4_STYLE|nr:UNKNOWN [Stylonychia lemnae]|eukprot:CDW76058.1 UNKNOWN [Stylonychia lemnae]